MDIINNAIGEYQQMIGIHDKQPWERSVERAVSQSLHNLTRKRAKVNKDLIDVDLVRGSTFSKIKPRHSWLTVSWKAFIRILFLPFYYKWWTSCCGRTGYALLVCLFVSQMSSIYVYMTDDLTPVDEALSLSHMLTPSIMILILAIVHTQIMSSTSDQQSSSSSSSSCPSNQINRDKQSSENLLKSTDTTTNVQDNNYTDRGRHACKYCAAPIATEDDDDDDVAMTCACDSSMSSPDVDSTEEKRRRKKKTMMIENDFVASSELDDDDDVNCRRRKEGKVLDDKKSSSSPPPSSSSGANECLCVNKNAATRRSKKHRGEEDDDDDDSCEIASLLLKTPSSGRTSDRQRMNKSDGHDTNSTTSSLNSEEDDDDDEEDDDVAVEDVVIVRDDAGDARGKISHIVKQRRHFEGRVSAEKSDCSRRSVDDKTTITINETDEPRRVNNSNNVQNNNTDPSEGCMVRKRHNVVVVVTQNVDAEIPNVSDSSQKSSATRDHHHHHQQHHHQPLRKNAVTMTTTKLKTNEKLFDEVEDGSLDGKAFLNHDETLNPEMADLLSPAIEFERKVSEEEEEEEEGCVLSCKQTSTELVRSYSKKSIATAGNKVSCIIWDGGELQKVDLTVLDIGWNIIKKVEKSCLSYDYLLLGVTFSVLLALTPIIFRVYHNWSLLEGMKINRTDFSVAMSVAVGYNWRQVMVICNGIVQRLCLSCLLFFMLAVSERTFYQRLLYAKNFCYLTSLRRARKYQLPHFRLNKVRNIKTWLSIRSFLKRRGPQRSVEIIVSTTFLAAVVIVSIICIELLQDYGSYLDELGNWELVVWGLSIGVFLLRFITLGTNINKKYRNFSVLITEQINLYLHMEQKPHKKNELMMANSVLKLAEDLLKEVESPFKVSGLSANPLLYNITKVVVLSAFSAVLTELLGFKLKLHKIKIRS